MDEIAMRAGLTKPILNRHFPSKHELYLELLDRCAGDIIVVIESSLALNGGNRSSGSALFKAFFQLHQDDNASFRLLFQTDLDDSEARDRVEAVEHWAVKAVAGHIRRETGLGEHQSLLMATALAGMTIAAARFWIRSPERISPDRAGELIAQIAWRGISRLPQDQNRSP